MGTGFRASSSPLQDGSHPQALRTDPLRRQLPPCQQCLLLSVRCQRGLGAGEECSVLSQHALGTLWSHSFITVRLWVPFHRPRGEADLQVGCEHEEEAEGPAPHRGPPLAAAWMCPRGSNLQSQLPCPPALPACGMVSGTQCAMYVQVVMLHTVKGTAIFTKLTSPSLP